MLLLHSGGQSSWGFEEVIGPLSKEFSCYALDMLGHGESDKPSSNFTWLDIVGSVEHFMDGLNIGRAHIVGASMGAAIAVELAAACPERVDRLVLVGCPVWSLDGAPERIRVRKAVLDEMGMPRPLTLEQLKERGTFANPRPEWVARINELYAKAGQSYYQTTVALAWYDIISRLHHVKASSTLIIYGEHDPTKDGGEILLHNIISARKVVMPGLAHHPATEDPTAFLAEVTSFLKGNGK